MVAAEAQETPVPVLENTGVIIPRRDLVYLMLHFGWCVKLVGRIVTPTTN